MTVREVAAALDLEVLTGDVGLDEAVLHGYASDLLSDVIANAEENTCWITVQRHVNILGVAKLKNIVAIITPRSLAIEKELTEKARAEGVALLRGRKTAFETAGLLYEALKKA